MQNILKLLAPIIPFITYRIYRDMYGEDVHLTGFPLTLKRFRPGFTTLDMEELNKAVWKAKKEAGLSLRDEVKVFVIDESFKTVSEDLRQMHNAKKIEYGDKTRVKI
jgi:valyl-tRNA synthetase